MQEAARREKRRLLDAQRGKSRIRLGNHLDEWCALKDHLGFSLHSQLAKFLLDSYRTSAGPKPPVLKAITQLSVSVPSLHQLAFLCHQHGTSCNSPPTILAQPDPAEGSETSTLLWGCKDEHQFSWDPHDDNEGLDGKNIKGDASVQSPEPENGAMGQENVPKITTEEGPESNMENTEIDPHSTSIQESHKLCPHECNEAGRSPEESPEPGGRWLLTTEISEKHQEQVTATDAGLSIAQEILVPAAEVADTEDEDEGPESEEISEDTQQSVSNTSSMKKLETARLGRACRNRRTLLSESCQQALMTEPKAALSVPCRRSPRSSKGLRMKADAKVQLPRTPRVTSHLKGQDVDLLLGSALSTDMQESLTEDPTSQETTSQNFDGPDTAEKQKDPLPGEPSDMGEVPRGIEEEEQSTAIESRENGGQRSPCKDQKTNRRQFLVDEELAQISKKRIRKATQQELLMCEYDDCGKIFSKRQYLNFHQKYQHMNQRTFRCSVTECGKTFNFKKHLKEHEKRHSDRRDFICEFCARAFRSSSNLIIHRRIHTGEKPLQCEFCGFTCRQKASLNWHMKKHDADSFYKFPCDICGQRFEKRDNLAAHKSRKHPTPRDTIPQETSTMDNACRAEAGHTETLAPEQKLPPTAPQEGKETLFPEYLDLSESVPEVSQQPVQAPGGTGISLVIVL